MGSLSASVAQIAVVTKLEPALDDQL